MLAENIGEINALSAVLKNSRDIQVKTGTWKWSEAKPFPPLEAVLKSPFWSDPEYENLRNRLKEGLLEPEVSATAEHVTVNMRGKKSKKSKTDSSKSSSSTDTDTKPTSGVIHLVPFSRLSLFPESLDKISYAMVVWEVGNDAAKTMNSYIRSLLRREVPLIVGGSAVEILDVLENIKNGLQDRNVLYFPIDIYYEDPKAKVYTFTVHRCAIITLRAPEFKVCYLSHPSTPWNGRRAFVSTNG